VSAANSAVFSRALGIVDHVYMETIMQEPLFHRVGIVGLGLIGASLALALKKFGVAKEIVGIARSQETIEQALNQKIVDQADTCLDSFLDTLDCIVLCTPLRAMSPLFDQMALFSQKKEPRFILTDAGSSKLFVVESARRAFGGELPPFFVPGHPIAGSEKSGIGAGTADLYIKHTVILTPEPETDALATEKIKSMWRRVGAKVDVMSVDQHDRYLAMTSHVPHLLSFSYMHAVASEKNDVLYDYAAGGLRDFTRIAASDPVVWRDIFTVNKKAVIAVLNQFEQHYQALKEAVISEDDVKIVEILTQSKGAREYFSMVLAERGKK